MAIRPPNLLSKIPPAPWFVRMSKFNLGLLTAAVFLVIFAINLMLDFMVAKASGSSLIGYVVSDCVAAMIATVLVAFSITLHNERREAVRRQLYVVAEMNHHVRNALDVIRMSAELTRDHDAINIISDEVNRIEWALRAVLGGESPADDGGEDKKFS